MAPILVKLTLLILVFFFNFANDDKRNSNTYNRKSHQKEFAVNWRTRHDTIEYFFPTPEESYRIYSNKRRGAYLIFRATSAALIRGRRLFINCTRQIYFFYIFIQRYTFYLLIFLWTVCASNRKTKERSWAYCAGKFHGPDIRASHSKNFGKRAYRPSSEIQSL